MPEKVLMRMEILETIFGELDLADLKTARLVCRIWSCEATRGFRNKIIVRHDPSLLTKTNPEEVAGFLTYYKLRHDLQILFVNPKSNHKEGEGTDSGYAHVYRCSNYLNNIEYIKILNKSFFRSSNAQYITVLEISLTMFHPKDPDFLVQLLSKTINLERLAMNFLLIKNSVFHSLPNELQLPLTKLKSLRFMACDHGEDYDFQFSRANLGPEQWDLDSWTKILRLFPEILFFDWYFAVLGENSDRARNYRQRLKTLYKEKQLFQNIKGLRANFELGEGGATVLVPFPTKLTYLILQDCVKKDREIIFPILSYHSHNLKRCELFLDRCKVEDPNETNMDFPNLPALEYFGISTNSKFFGMSDNENKKANFDVRMTDVLNWRKIFMEGSEKFKSVFPSLHTINIAIPCGFDKEFFNYTFPKEAQIKIPGIKSFGISLFDECDSEEITRFYTMFPDLEILKHGNKGGVEDPFICEHKRDYASNTFYKLPMKLTMEPKWRKLIRNSMTLHSNQLSPCVIIDPIYYLLRGSFQMKLYI